MPSWRGGWTEHVPTFIPVSLETLPGWAREVLAEARVARLGYLDEDDHPRVLPVTFAVAGGAVWSAIDEKPKRSAEPARLRHLRRRPEAALLVDRYDDDWTRLAWVQLLGRVDVLPVDSAPEAIEALARKYAPYAGADAAGPATQAHGRAHASVALDGQLSARPLAPRAGIEAAALEACHLGGEQEHACGHARAAIGHELAAALDAGGLEAGAEFLGRQEAAVRGELLEGKVRRARDVARHRVDRLELAAVALGRSGVEQETSREHFRLGGIALPRTGHERSRRNLLGASFQRPTLRPPAAQATVEHRHAPVAEMTQQPPEPGRASLGGLVVGHHQRVGADSGAARGRFKDLGVRQWVPSPLAGLRRQFAVEIHEHRTRDVAGSPELFPGAGLTELEAAIHDPNSGIVEPLAQPGRGKQGPAHAARTFRHMPGKW